MDAPMVHPFFCSKERREGGWIFFDEECDRLDFGRGEK